MSTRRIPLRLPPALLFFLLLLLLLSRSLSRSTGRAAPAVPPPPPFRVVLNDAAFRPHETDLMKEFIAASPAFKLVDVVTTRNRNVTSGFDYLLTNRAGAKAAYEAGTSGVVSVVPGLLSLTHKSMMTRTLKNTPGVAPPSFRIPVDVDDLIAYVEEHPEEHGDIWVLKENKHRGQGVTPVYLRDVLSRMVLMMSSSKGGKNPVVLVQKFVENQLLLNDVPFTFRVWTAIGGGWNTSRAYAFDGSIVPLGDKKFASSAPQGDRLKLAQDMVVNLFLQDREQASDPWAIDGEFKRYLRGKTGSDEAFEGMWELLKRKTARTLAAAIPEVRSAVQRECRDTYRDNGFEFLGFDFLVDQSFEPHLIEVNHLPSMATKVPGQRTDGSVFDRQKELFVHGLLTVVAETARRRPVHRALARRAGCPAGSKADLVLDMLYEARLATENGFSVLTTDMYNELHVHYPMDAVRSLQQRLRWLLPEMRSFAGPKASDRDLAMFDEVVRRTLRAVEARPDERFETVVLQTLCNAGSVFKDEKDEKAEL